MSWVEPEVQSRLLIVSRVEDAQYLMRFVTSNVHLSASAALEGDGVGTGNDGHWLQSRTPRAWSALKPIEGKSCIHVILRILLIQMYDSYDTCLEIGMIAINIHPEAWSVSCGAVGMGNCLAS